VNRAAFVPIGRVAKTHGLDGELSVILRHPTQSTPSTGITVWFVPPPSGVRSGRLESIRQGPKGPLFTISGVDDIDAAASLVGSTLVVSPDDVPTDWAGLDRDDAGLRVEDAERGSLGTVVETIVTGANDVWIVEGPLGQVLVPVIDDVVIEIDEAARVAHVRLLPGLLEEEG
jgi:16S rRNA processing protein RimM